MIGRRRVLTGVAAPPASEIERVFRAEYGRAVAILVRVFGGIDVAEDAVQDAFTAATQHWPSTGLSPSPAGWIITTARNRAIDHLRREVSRDDRHAQAALLHARDEPFEEGPVRGDRTNRQRRRARPPAPQPPNAHRQLRAAGRGGTQLVRRLPAHVRCSVG
jgi:RNA polymerase sigma-70 factor (ECF subfamily)